MLSPINYRNIGPQRASIEEQELKKFVSLLSTFALTATVVVAGAQSASAALPANSQTAYNYFVARGLTPVQSAGIVGNLIQESSIDPGKVQTGGGKGRGIAQWGIGQRWDTSVNDNMAWYAAQNGTSITDLNGQLGFIWYELTTIGYGYSQLKQATTVASATDIFMSKFELCGDCQQSDRETYAQQVLTAFGGTSAPVSSVVAFQANSGLLWTWSGSAGSVGVGSNAKLSVRAGTSPAVAVLSGGKYAVAYQAPDGELWTWVGNANGSGGSASAAHLSMIAGTSPSIAAVGGKVVVAFQANVGRLWTWSGAPGTVGVGADSKLGMKAGTSPSVTVVGGKAAVAFQANTGGLWTWSGAPATVGVGTNVKLGMKAGTSPSITAVGGQAAVAFQANTGSLWTWAGTPGTVGVGTNVKLGMKAGTSPSITAVGGKAAVAFQANTGHLWTWSGATGTAGVGADAKLSMYAGSSPSISSSGGYAVVAFEASTASLYTWIGAPGTVGSKSASAKLGMKTGTSPATS